MLPLQSFIFVLLLSLIFASKQKGNTEKPIDRPRGRGQGTRESTERKFDREGGGMGEGNGIISLWSQGKKIWPLRVCFLWNENEMKMWMGRKFEGCVCVKWKCKVRGSENVKWKRWWEFSRESDVFVRELISRVLNKFKACC